MADDKNKDNSGSTSGKTDTGAVFTNAGSSKDTPADMLRHYALKSDKK